MTKTFWKSMVVAITIAALGTSQFAFAFGGRGGGAGGRVGGGGFGGGARPSGGFGGGGARPSGGFSGGSRPSMGSSPSFSRPSAPASRPNVGGGGAGMANRPSTLPANRPVTGSGIGNRPGGGGTGGTRPSTLPANRPGSGIGSGQGIGSGSGIANRPGGGSGIANNRPGGGTGIANRPGVGGGLENGLANRPGRLPGLGEGGAGSRLPNQGAGIQDRRSDLGNRMSNGREDWQNHRQNMQNDRQDWRDNHREDWQNWANNHQNWHGNWYHNCWHPGAGWGYMWDRYPVAAAIGLTAWGVNRIAWGWGYWGYSNPYYVAGGTGYDYSQPLVNYQSTDTAAPSDPSANTAPTADSQPPAEGMAALDAARNAFRVEDYTTALTKTDEALKTMPSDTAVHEFRGLTLFALKRYPESAAAIYAVLAAGPGWDWTTMISLYGSADSYTAQLRALEQFAKANPKSPDAHFLLGYHYQTCNHAENSARQFKLTLSLLPDDKLIKQLVAVTSPPNADDSQAPPPAPPAVAPDKVLKADQLVGNWKATNQGSTFQLDMAKDGSFTWTYSSGGKTQSVKGVYAIDQNNLALEMNDNAGTMLAEVDFANPSQFQFKMVTGDEKDPGLKFTKG